MMRKEPMRKFAKDDLSMGVIDENVKNNMKMGEMYRDIEDNLTIIVID